jgi:hypothetical protein
MKREIASYDRSSAEIVSRSVRELADLQPALVELEQIMRRAVAGVRRQSGWTPDDRRVLEEFVQHWPASEQALEWQFNREREQIEELRVGLDGGGMPTWVLAARDVWRSLIR